MIIITTAITTIKLVFMIDERASICDIKTLIGLLSLDILLIALGKDVYSVIEIR